VVKIGRAPNQIRNTEFWNSSLVKNYGMGGREGGLGTEETGCDVQTFEDDFGGIGGPPVAAIAGVSVKHGSEINFRAHTDPSLLVQGSRPTHKRFLLEHRHQLI
jgi:hypothetical protein